MGVSEGEGKKNKGKGRLIWWLVFVLCGMVFLGSAIAFMSGLSMSYKEKQTNAYLASLVQQGERISVLRLLARQNPDFAGWLSVAETDLSYPVMYTPAEPEYYLHRGFDKSDAASGCLFIGEGSAPDSSHIVIYGHNMKNGTMFGALMPYAKKDYWQAHPLISFDNLAGEGVYEIIGVFYSQVYREADEGVFRYYRYTDLMDEERFQQYIRQVKVASLYDTGVMAEYGDQILTLSTCSYHMEDGRFVVVARRKAE